MITVTDVLTNKTWVLPNSVGTNPLYMGQFPPGRYDISNGSGASITVLGGLGNKGAIIPNGATWNLATQENDRSSHKSAIDYVIWQHSGRFN